MIILLDTSTSECQLTIVDADKTITHRWLAERTLAKELLKFLAEKLSEAGGDLHQISGIGVMKGPGSFTGLRIGITVANTLADGLGVAIVGEQGPNWQKKALAGLRVGRNDSIVLPDYGADPHITQPRK